MLRNPDNATRCVHFGQRLTMEEGAQHEMELLLLDVKQPTCGKERHEYHCKQKKFTNIGKCCICKEWQPHQIVRPKLQRVIRIDQNTLAPTFGGVRVNPSIIQHPQGGYVFAYRNSWPNANISVIRLNQRFQGIGDPVYLNLSYPGATIAGKEDPRLFWHKGKIHIWYMGWNGRKTKDNPNKCNVLFARLDNDTLAV